jgi:hypothetical protein
VAAEIGIPARDIADVIAFAVSRPQRMALNEILVRPTAQAMRASTRSTTDSVHHPPLRGWARTGLRRRCSPSSRSDQFLNRWLRWYRGAADMTRACGAT